MSVLDRDFLHKLKSNILFFIIYSIYKVILQCVAKALEKLVAVIILIITQRTVIIKFTEKLNFSIKSL